MAGGLAALAQVGVMLQLTRADAGVACQEFHGRARKLLRGSSGPGRDVQLSAVAGGDQRGLGRGALQPLTPVARWCGSSPAQRRS